MVGKKGRIRKGKNREPEKESRRESSKMERNERG